MNEIQIFSFNSADIRVAEIDGDPWFVALDIAEALGYSTTQALTRRLDDDEKGMRILHTLGGVQSVTTINESGLYSAILGSTRLEAKAFKRWITGEVLPSIRRHGGYIAATPDESPDVVMARAVLVAQATIDRQKAQIAEQTEQLRLQAPAVEYVNDVLASDSLITINAVAQHLGVSARRLNQFLVEREWIYKQGGIYYASCKVRDRGYFDFHVVPYINSAGDKCTRSHLKATEAGRRAIIELWEKHQKKGA
ncbi:MAG: BRO family protein [Victivallaceae bacterium]